MKIVHLLLVIFSLGIPANNVTYPHYYYPKPKKIAKVTYCNTQYCHCSYCDPYTSHYNYDNYAYYPENIYECPEHDNTPTKIFIIWAIIAAAAYLIDSVSKS